MAPVEVLELRPGFRQFHGFYATLPCLVFTPTDAGPHPLIVHLEDKRDGDAAHLIVAPSDTQKTLTFAVEQPHMPLEHFPFCTVSPVHRHYSKSLDSVVSMCEAFARDLEASCKKVDFSRLYLSGVGAGAAAALELVAAQPTTFVAFVLVSSVVPPPPSAPPPAAGLPPVWLFLSCTERDKAAMVAAAEQSLSSAGCREVRVTACVLGLPNACERAYLGPELYEWFLSHGAQARRESMAGAARRSSKSIIAPATRNSLPI